MPGNDPPTGEVQQIVAVYLRSREASAAVDRLVQQRIPTSGVAIVCRRERSSNSGPIVPVLGLVIGAAVAGAVVGAVSGVLVQVWERGTSVILTIPVAVSTVFGAAAAALVAVLWCAVAVLARQLMRTREPARYYEVRVGAAFVDRAVRILHGGVDTVPDDPTATP